MSAQSVPHIPQLLLSNAHSRTTTSLFVDFVALCTQSNRTRRRIGASSTAVRRTNNWSRIRAVLNQELVGTTTVKSSESKAKVKIGLRVLTRPVPDQLPAMYRTLGVNYNERVLPSIIHETLKVVVAQYNASQLITQREAVSREIRKVLTARAASFNIALDDVSITRLTFGKEFTVAIEAKQIAAQEAERAKFVVEKAKHDKRSAIIRAQATTTTKFATDSIPCH